MALTTSNDCFRNSKAQQTVKLTCILRTSWYRHRQVGPKKTPRSQHPYVKHTRCGTRLRSAMFISYYTGSIFSVRGRRTPTEVSIQYRARVCLNYPTYVSQQHVIISVLYDGSIWPLHRCLFAFAPFFPVTPTAPDSFWPSVIPGWITSSYNKLILFSIIQALGKH